jgi:Phage major capsid protein E
MALWELEEFQDAQFLGFVRSIPVPDDFLAIGGPQPFLPMKTTSTLEYEYLLGAQNRQARTAAMAHVMGWDSEAPIAARLGYPPAEEATVRGELPPIKRKAKLSEKEIIKFKQPRPGTSDRSEVLDYVYQLSTDLVTGIQSRLEWLAMQAISEDRVVINSEGVDVAVDFGIPTTQQFNVNTDDNLSTWWEDTTNSNPVTDLDFICNQFEVDHNGVRPGRLVCDTTTEQVLLNNVNIRELVRGPGASTIRLTRDELNSVLAIYELPSLYAYNVTLWEENHDGTLTSVRPFNRNKVVLLPDAGVTLGNVLLGPTAESRSIPGIAYSQYAPGIVGRVYGQDEPPSEWVKVAAVGFPTLPGADLVVQMLARNNLT